MGTPTKLEWDDAEASTDVFPDVTPQMVAAVMQALAGTPLAADPNQQWEHTEQNELRDVVDNNAQCLIDHMADTNAHGGGVGGGSGFSSDLWEIGNTSRRASVLEGGIIVAYVATAAASDTQIAQIAPGTNTVVWLPENYRSLVIGDGSATQFTFDHGLVDGHVTVQVRNVSTGDLERPHIRNQAGVCTVNFSTAPNANSYQIEVSR